MLKTIALTVLATVLLGAGAAAAFIHGGVYNVAATDRHWSATARILETARIRSIKAHATGIVVPAGYGDQAKMLSAVSHFSAHCARCHGAPGVDRNEFAEGMYPQPPDLKDAAKRYTLAELFWIVKNGIKMSGMPSMADDGDDMLWATVGLLEKLPDMTTDAYHELWMASQAQGGGHHHMEDMDGMQMHGATDHAHDKPAVHDEGQTPSVHQDSGKDQP